MTRKAPLLLSRQAVMVPSPLGMAPLQPLR
jgi:hypothetical protein